MHSAAWEPPTNGIGSISKQHNTYNTTRLRDMDGLLQRHLVMLKPSWALCLPWMVASMAVGCVTRKAEEGGDKKHFDTGFKI